jgi:hypothetical protein
MQQADDHRTHVILVAWSHGGAHWRQVKDALAEAVGRVLGGEAEPAPGLPHDPFEGVRRRLLGRRGDVRVLYCGENLGPVEETVRHAVAEGANKVVICPLLLALESRLERDEEPGWLSSVRELRGLEEAFPSVEILYAGPPFPRGADMERFLKTVREEEPVAADRLKRVVKLGFKGDWDLFAAFMETLQAALPPETRVAMRGSSVTGVNHLTGAPFDRAGPGTSDLDLTLVGEAPLSRWHLDGFYIPGALTMPLGDEDPGFAPWLEPTRRTLQRMVGRPLHIQAMSWWLLEVRRGLLGMPYLFLDA